MRIECRRCRGESVCTWREMCEKFKGGIVAEETSRDKYKRMLVCLSVSVCLYEVVIYV